MKKLKSSSSVFDSAECVWISERWVTEVMKQSCAFVRWAYFAGWKCVKGVKWLMKTEHCYFSCQESHSLLCFFFPFAFHFSQLREIAGRQKQHSPNLLCHHDKQKFLHKRSEFHHITAGADRDDCHEVSLRWNILILIYSVLRLFICGGPCHLSSYKQCCGEFVLLPHQLCELWVSKLLVPNYIVHL